jgi:serine/threonine protein kinase
VIAATARWYNGAVRRGQRIGKYVLDERIAVGGMAEVWAARAEGPEGFVKPIALKFILESFTGDPELERLFVNEARIAAQLQHANLVAVFDFDKMPADDGAGGAAGRYYIAMERVEGRDLRRLAEAAGRAGYVFPVGLALYLGGEVLKALRYVHERRAEGRALGLVHRDVSPHNVLVGYASEVKLSDFGIAKTRAHSARGTKTGNVRGKLAYASPEQLNGEPVDHRTDQFALGATLWELLAGRRLFAGHDDLDTIARVIRCEVPPLSGSSAGRAVPPAVESFLRHMLAARREDRFQTTGEALSALLALPSYSADGQALGDLARNLFLPSAIDLPPTMPIQAAPEAARLAATRTMRPRRGSARASPASESAHAAPAAGPGTPGSQAPTRRQAVDLHASRETTVDVTGRGGWRRVALAAAALGVAGLAVAVVTKRRGAPALAQAAPEPAGGDAAPVRAMAAGEGARATPVTPEVRAMPGVPAGTASLEDGSRERGAHARKAALADSAGAGHAERAGATPVPTPPLATAPVPTPPLATAPVSPPPMPAPPLAAPGPTPLPPPVGPPLMPVLPVATPGLPPAAVPTGAPVGQKPRSPANNAAILE